MDIGVCVIFASFQEGLDVCSDTVWFDSVIVMRDDLATFVDQNFVEVPLNVNSVSFQPFEEVMRLNSFNLSVSSFEKWESERTIGRWWCSICRSPMIVMKLLTGSIIFRIRSSIRSEMIAKLIAWEGHDFKIACWERSSDFLKLLQVLLRQCRISVSCVDDKNGFSSSDIVVDWPRWLQGSSCKSCSGICYVVEFDNLNVEEVFASSELSLIGNGSCHWRAWVVHGRRAWIVHNWGRRSAWVAVSLHYELRVGV